MNEINELDISNLVNLEKLECGGNKLTNLSFLEKIPNPRRLAKLNIVANNFSKQKLSCLSHLTGLRTLEVRDNRIIGSLENLKDLTKLKKLDITNTDIIYGLEYLSDSIQEFYCRQESESQLKTIEQELKKYGEPEDEYENVANLLSD